LAPSVPERSQALADKSIRQLMEQANQVFEHFLDQMQQKEFENTAWSYKGLENTLNQLEEM